jgi:plastocyanin
MSIQTAATIPARCGAAWVIAVIGTFLFLATPDAAAAADSVTIEISNYSFIPPEVTIAPGTTVVWVNHDESPHTIVSTDHVFGSKAMDTDDRYSFTFDKEGDFGYVCSLHPYMAGSVKVRRP